MAQTTSGFTAKIGKSLTNAVRHAKARAVSLALSYTDDCIALSVHDDGTGFAIASARTKEGHYRLPGMRERADEMGASFHIETQLGNGTRLEVAEPLLPSQRTSDIELH